MYKAIALFFICQGGLMASEWYPHPDDDIIPEENGGSMSVPSHQPQEPSSAQSTIDQMQSESLQGDPSFVQTVS